eukprot:scaffold23575_cov62-Isochrysis_galbana.AAC.1
MPATSASSGCNVCAINATAAAASDRDGPRGEAPPPVKSGLPASAAPAGEGSQHPRTAAAATEPSSSTYSARSRRIVASVRGCSAGIPK